MVNFAKYARRLKRLYKPAKPPPCPRCGAPPGQRGILILRTGVLEQLERRPDGSLVPIRCPNCLEPPFAVLPENERDRPAAAP
jgi:hypothetical protein